MSLVVDASVALKWVVEEEGSDAALALIGAEPLIAPEFLLLECANVLAVMARRGQIATAAAEISMNAIQAVPLRLTSTIAHIHAAQAIAMQLGRSAYDSLYLAVALAEGATLITADARFANAATADTAYATAVRLLS